VTDELMWFRHCVGRHGRDRRREFLPSHYGWDTCFHGDEEVEGWVADPAKVREAFGFEMKALEEMVVDATQQYLELLPQFT
jgi:hypothetical protein